MKRARQPPSGDANKASLETCRPSQAGMGQRGIARTGARVCMGTQSEAGQGRKQAAEKVASIAQIEL